MTIFLEDTFCSLAQRLKKPPSHEGRLILLSRVWCHQCPIDTDVRERTPSIYSLEAWFPWDFGFVLSLPGWVLLPSKYQTNYHVLFPPFICFEKIQWPFNIQVLRANSGIPRGNARSYRVSNFILFICYIIKLKTPSQAISKTISSYYVIHLHLYSQIESASLCWLRNPSPFGHSGGAVKKCCACLTSSVSFIVQAIHLRLWGPDPGVENKKVHIQPCRLSFCSTFVPAQ